MFPFFILFCLFGQLFAEEHSLIGMYAVHMPTGKVLIEENSHQSFIPASCLKIVTTGAAFYLLGPQMQFETELSYDGEIVEGVLQGNVYIEGGGDPCLGSEKAGALACLQEWSEKLKEIGIKKIEGKIVGDDSKWEKALAVPSWLWEDLGNYYGAGASALSFHENKYSLVFKPGNQVGERAEILRTEPFISYLQFNNEVKTGPEGSGDRAAIYGSEFSPVQYVRGTVPFGGSEFIIKGAIPNPAESVVGLFEEALKGNGILVEKKEFSFSVRKKLHTLFSPPLSQIAYWTNQESINLFAEHLLKKMGEICFKEGSTETGKKAVFNFWKEKGMNTSGLFIADGSGLSRKNLITPRQLVYVLTSMKKSDYFSDFFASLPDLGRGIKAKSGTMSQIKAVTGYLDEIAFAILINQEIDNQRIRKKIDSFFDFLVKKNNCLQDEGIQVNF